MTSSPNAIERLREAKPTDDAQPPELAQILDAIEREARERDRGGAVHAPVEAARTVRRSLKRAPLAVVIALVASAAAAAAFAATHIFATGTPVTPHVGLEGRPSQGPGVPVASSVRLLPIAVPDPSGGPPWGMREFKTTRGLGCVQVGRLLHARFGVLGQAHAFHDDGRFHPLGLQVGVGPSCVPPDERGHSFLPGGTNGAVVTSSGLDPSNGAAGQRTACDLPGEHDWGVRCPQRDLRQVDFGLLGPEAASVTYTIDGRTHTAATVGPDGAYLIVAPARPGANQGDAGAYGRMPPPLIRRVTYRNGSICRVRDAGPLPCPPVGAVLAAQRPPTAAQLATPIHAAIKPYHYRVDRRYQVARPDPKSLPNRVLTVSFKARVPIRDTRSSYAFEIRRPIVRDCFGGSVILGGGPTNSTIARGQRVRLAMPLTPACRGPYRGRVFFVEDTTRQASWIAPAWLGYFAMASQNGRDPHPGITVGRFSIRVP